MFDLDNKNVINGNLDQGKKLLHYNDEINEIVAPNLKAIQLGSLLEGLDGVHMSHNDTKSLEGLQNVENKFNQTLAQYTQTYQSFSKDLLDNSQTKKKIVDYLGKVVSDVDGNNYYVNNFGFTHKYSPNAWENNNSSCPSTTISYSDSMTNFDSTMPMVQGQPCKIAGQNVKNKTTGEEAWVDIRGMKHPYNNAQKNKTCSSKSIELSSTDYNLIPSGSAMSGTTPCLAMDVNPNVWSKLQQLNAQLKTQAIELTTKIKDLTLENTETKEQLMHKRQELLKYIDTMDDNTQNIASTTGKMMQINGEEIDSNLRMTSNYYSYIIWIFVMILIVFLTMSASTNASTNGSNTVQWISYVIISIFMLMFLIYLYKNVTGIHY